MAQTQKVTLPDGGVTWTVLDRDYAVVKPVEQWLEWLRVACACSPNTVKAYSPGSHCGGTTSRKPVSTGAIRD